MIVITLLALFVSGVNAQNTLTIHQKDGKQISFGFDEKPVVSFTDNYLVVKSGGAEVQYALSTFSKLTFDDKEAGVDGIGDDAGKASVSLDEYVVAINGAKADIPVRLVALDGKEIQSYKTDKEGAVTFSIADLPEGIYIISSESLTVKILKK